MQTEKRDERSHKLHPPLNITNSRKESIMSNLNINASSDFLNDFEWQLQRLALFIEMVEGFALSLRDLSEALNIILKEAKATK